MKRETVFIFSRISKILYTGLTKLLEPTVFLAMVIAAAAGSALDLDQLPDPMTVYKNIRSTPSGRALRTKP